MPAAQMEKFYGSQEQREIYLYMGYAFRGFNTHGSAMFTLVHRAMAGRNEDDYVITDGERICSTADRLELRRRPHAQRAVDRRDAGAVPFRTRRGARDPARRATDSTGRRQEYRLVDAATGEFERGYVNVADMVTGQPWTDDIPVHVTWQKDSADAT